MKGKSFLCIILDCVDLTRSSNKKHTSTILGESDYCKLNTINKQAILGEDIFSGDMYYCSSYDQNQTALIYLKTLLFITEFHN